MRALLGCEAWFGYPSSIRTAPAWAMHNSCIQPCSTLYLSSQSSIVDRITQGVALATINFNLCRLPCVPHTDINWWKSSSIYWQLFHPFVYWSLVLLHDILWFSHHFSLSTLLWVLLWTCHISPIHLRACVWNAGWCCRPYSFTRIFFNKLNHHKIGVRLTTTLISWILSKASASPITPVFQYAIECTLMNWILGKASTTSITTVFHYARQCTAHEFNIE